VLLSVRVRHCALLVSLSHGLHIQKVIRTAAAVAAAHANLNVFTLNFVLYLCACPCAYTTDMSAQTLKPSLARAWGDRVNDEFVAQVQFQCYTHYTF
jgi:hypothetical protein